MYAAAPQILSKRNQSMPLNLKDKLDAILSFIDKKTAQDSTESAASVVKSNVMEERAAFESAIKETLKSGSMSYDEAVIRIRVADFSPEDKNIILAQIADFEATAIKTASVKTQEVETMDPVTEEINRIGERLPAYANWLAETLKKDGHLLGTGGKPEVDKMSLQTKKDDVKTIDEANSEEVKRMKRDDKRTAPETRTKGASTKSAGAESYVKTPGGNATESKVTDSQKYDNGVIEEEVADAKKNEAKGNERDKKDRAKKDEYLRASDSLSVKFSSKANAWVIADAKTGEIAVQASLEDITGGRTINAAALSDIKSATFGEMIKEDIDTIGLEATAKNLLGDSFDKLAAEALGDSTVKTSEENTQRLYVLKSMLSTLKTNLTKVAKHPLVASLVKQAEGGIAVLTDAIGEGAPTEELPFAEAAAPMEALVSVDEMVSGEGEAAQIGEELKSSLTDPAQIAQVDQLVELAMAGREEEEEGTKKLEDAEHEEGETEAEVETEEEEEKEEEKEEKSENPFAKKDKKEEPMAATAGSAVRNALKKLASDKSVPEPKRPNAEEGDYEVTPALNWNAMAEHNKGNITVDGKKFMTFESLQNEFKGLATQHATGKLAAFVGNLVKGAELAKKAGMSAKQYYTQVLGDASYVNEWISKKTPESVESEFKKNDKEANKGNNAYATGAIKMKHAMEMSQKMQKKGMIASTTTAADQQVKDFMAMDETSFKAFASSVEFVSPTTEVEEGRFLVKKMAKADRDGNVVVGAVDGIECVYMNGSDIQSEDGTVTKAHLEGALELLKRAFEEGFLEEPLSGGKIQNTPGVGNFEGLTLGKQESKPLLSANDLR